MEENASFPPQFAGRRAAAYWFSDGLPEVAFGSALAACGGVGFAWVVYFLHWWMRAGFLLTTICLLVLYLWDRKILDVVKARLTYPRTGYAQPPADGYPEGEYILTLKSAPALTAKKNVTAFRMGTVYFFFLGSIFVGLFNDRWSLAIVMFVVACIVYWAQRWSEHPYSWWSMLPLALSGIPLSLMALPARVEKFLPMLLGGLWLFCHGAWTMARYLRLNRRPQTAESDARVS